MTATANTAAPFAILTAGNLDKSIVALKGKFSTAGAALHQCAASALHHVEKHACASRVNAVYAATPASARKAVVQWFEHMGRVKFDSAKGQFTFAKKRRFLADEMMTVSPMEFAKASGSKAAKAQTADRFMAQIAKRLEAIETALDESDIPAERLADIIGSTGKAKRLANALADILKAEAESAAEAEKQAALQSALEAGSAAKDAATAALEKAESEAATARKGKGRQPAKGKASKGKVKAQTASKPRPPKGGQVLEAATVH